MADEKQDVKELFAALAAPHDPADVEWRVGATTKDNSRALALAYQDARAVMDRLDDVLGPENWRDEYERWGEKGVKCRLWLRIDGEWFWKEDGADETDIETTKGGISDAFKRAAVKWGIGRYLYHIESPWVAIEPWGRSYRIIDAEKARLRKLLGGAVEESGVEPPVSFPRGIGPATAMPKGEHEGTPVGKVPIDYLERLVEEAHGAWKQAAKAELARRQKGGKDA